MRMRRIPAVVLALAVTFGVAACGDDDTSTDAAKGDGKATASGASIETFCEGVFDFDAQTRLGPNGPEDPAAVKQLFTPIVDTLTKTEKAAPTAVAGDVAVLLDAGKKAVDTGEMPEIFSPQIQGALTKIHNAVGTECGYSDVSVTGVDYSFQGIKSAYEAGRINLNFENAGKEEHEIVVLRKKADVTDSWDAIINQPGPEQVLAKVDLVAMAFAPPGASSATTAELSAGEYLALCFIPVGGAENGAPHFTHGMRAEFTVS